MRRSSRLLGSCLLAITLAGCSTWEGSRRYASGTRALDRGDTELAVRELERAAELVPHASEVRNHLGLAYAAEGRDAEALRAFEKAVELDCDNEAAVENLRAVEARSAEHTAW
jgi:Flp pilus assembly protein TadD